jgi:hypothetical protein
MLLQRASVAMTDGSSIALALTDRKQSNVSFDVAGGAYPVTGATNLSHIS